MNHLDEKTGWRTPIAASESNAQLSPQQADTKNLDRLTTVGDP
jgi:hypothetical protein